MTDEHIIGLIWNRKESGLTEIRKKYGLMLERIAGEMLSREDAEECVNDTYLALWKHIPPAHPDNLQAYTISILKNLVRDRWRKMNAAKRRVELVELSDELIDCIPDAGFNTEEEAIFNASNKLNRFLEAQTPVKRGMFVLRYWYGKSTVEIAGRYGYSVSGTEKVLFHLRKKLKKYLEEE